jgi:hypothetical protein
MEYLFDRFWDWAMNRVLVDAKSQDQGILSKTYGKKELPSRKKVRRAIVFAAKAMEQESQTELLIAKIQPTWLQNKRQQRLYRSIVGLIGGLVVGLVVGLSFGLTVGLSFGLTVGLSGGLGWLIGWLSGGLDTIEPVEAIKISTSCQERRKTLSSLRKYLMVGLSGGLIVWLIVWLIAELSFGLSFGLMVWLIGLLGWLMVGLTGGLAFWLIRGRKADIEDRIVPNQGIKNSRSHMLLLTGAVLLTAILHKLLLKHLLAGGTTGHTNLAVLLVLLAVFLYGFYAGGGLPLCQHIALRIVLAWNGYAPYRYDKLLNYCTERLLLQRIGGRYRFMHKLLQEHFAKMPLD